MKVSASNGSDSLYIETYKPHISVGFWISNPTYSMIITPKPDNLLDTSILRFSSSFQANYKAALGFDLSYRIFQLSIGFRSKTFALDENIHGKTNYKNLALGLHLKPFYIQAIYRNYSGFYDNQSKNYDSSLKPIDPYYYRNDLRNTYSKLYFMWYSNKDQYSYGSVFSYSERQKKGRGSFLIAGQMYHSSIKADSAIIHPLIREAYGDFGAFKDTEVWGIGMGPGFARNFIIKRFSISFMITAFAELQRNRVVLGDGRTNGYQNQLSVIGDTRLGFSYQNKRFFWGLYARGDRHLINLRIMDINSSFTSVVMVFGWRFNPPEKLENWYLKNESKFVSEYDRLKTKFKGD